MSEDQQQYILSDQFDARGKYTQIMQKELSDFPVTVEGYSIGISEEATSEQKEEIGRVLVLMEHESSALHRFLLGDWYNSLPSTYGEKRRILESVIDKFDDKKEKLYRNYGWIASKWPPQKRSGKYAWNHFKTNRPDTPPKDKPDYEALREARLKDALYEAYFQGAVDYTGGRQHIDRKHFDRWFANRLHKREQAGSVQEDREGYEVTP